MSSGCVRRRPRGVEGLEEVVGHRHARLDRALHLAESLRRGVDLGSHQQCGLGREAHLGDKLGHRDEALVDKQVRIPGVLVKPLVGIGVGAEDGFQPVPGNPARGCYLSVAGQHLSALHPGPLVPTAVSQELHWNSPTHSLC